MKSESGPLTDRCLPSDNGAMKILAISGSLRAQSTNKSLLLALKNQAPRDIHVDIFEDLSALPFFNPDLDTDTPPPSVQRFRTTLQKSQALIISTPEYAHGLPGVLKNALDWLVSDPQFAGKRVGLIYGSATEGSHAHQSLLEILKTMSAEVIPDAVVSIPAVRTKIDSTGKVLDPQVQAKMSAMLKALLA